jgi:hypothetical protein
MIENGLKEAAGYSSRRLSDFQLVQGAGSEEYLELCYKEPETIGGATPVYVDTPDIIKSHIPPDDVIQNTHASSRESSLFSFDANVKKDNDVPDCNRQTQLSPLKNAIKDLVKVDTPVRKHSNEVLVHKSSSESLYRNDEDTYQRQTSVGSVSSVDSQNVICEQPKPMNSVPNSDGLTTGKRHAVYDLTVDIDKVTHVESVQQSSCDNGEGVLSSPHEKSNDPLEFIDDITKVEPIQETALSQLPQVAGVTHGSSEFQDLDSPESLKEIDREDCFSWEDDKLLLEIEEELDTSVGQSKDAKSILNLPQEGAVGGELDSNITPVHNESSTEKRASKNIQFYSEFYVPLDDQDISNGKALLSHSSSQNSLSSQGSSSGHGQIRAAGAFLKNKLHLPRGGKRSPSKTSVDGENLGSEKRPYSPTTLEIDACGFPLSVFTKVR